MNRAARTLGFAAELAAIGAAGLLELLSPRDTSGEHFAGAAASLADERHSLSAITEDADGCGFKAHCMCGRGFSAYTKDGAAKAHHLHQNQKSPQPSPVTTHTSADDSSAAAGTLPPTVAAEPLTWLGWSVPAILDVLATHRYQQVVGRCSCDIRARGTTHGTHADYAEHVAPLIAERIACDTARAVAALQNFQPK